MIDTVVHPGLVLIAGGIVLAGLRGPLRAALTLSLPMLALWLVWQLPDGALWRVDYLGHTLTPLQGDKLSRLFATLFALMAAGGGLFALSQKSRIEVPAAFVYAGSAIGVALAGDLISVFVFWELMAVGSTVVLWSQGSRAAYRASLRYLMIHLLGGVLLFAGISGHIAATGSVDFTRLTPDSPAQWLILIGFLINAGAPPLSAWLPDAYPEASWSGTVFLSAFTTKTAVYALMRGFAGTELLVWVGLFMVFYGIVYALLDNDMRRLIAYSIVAQVGFMVAAVGIGTELALNGAAAQAFAGTFYTALMLMAAGSVLQATQRRKLSQPGGLYRRMPLTAVCGCVGALSVSAFPLTSGFISKSMISQAAADGHLLVVWLLMTAAAAGMFLHAGLRFPWLVFFGNGGGNGGGKDSGEHSSLRPADPPASMRWAMLIYAALCIALGIWYEPLYRLLPHAVAYTPYTGAHVLTQLQLLLFAALAFVVMLRFVERAPTITLDADWLWRRALPALVLPAARRMTATHAASRHAAVRALRAVLTQVRQHHGPQGRIASTWPTGSMALWVLVLLLGYLLLYYLL